MIDDDALRGVLALAHGALRTFTRERADTLPEAVRPLVRVRRLDRRHAAILRRALEESEVLRAAVLSGVREASREGDLQLSPVEWLWLERPEGWEGSVRTLIELQLEERRIERLQLEERGVQRRLEAVEDHLARARADVERLEREVTAERSERERLQLETGEAGTVASGLRQQVEQMQNEVRRAKENARHAEERAADAKLALEAEAALRREAEEHLAAARLQFERALSARVAAEQVMLQRLEAAAEAPAAPPRTARHAPGREPIAIPGGRYGSDVEVAKYLLSLDGIVVLIDGYNVAKTQWPDVPALALRERLIEIVESVVRSTGVRVHVVFDGDDGVVGWTGARRLVNVHFSRGGDSGDDLMRRLARAFPDEQPIVAVTTDRELANSLRHLGANVIASQQFLDAVT